MARISASSTKATALGVTLAIGLSLTMSALALGHVGNVEPGIIHSCVASGGTVRIIAADGTCRPNETALDWNAQGVLPEPASVLVDCAAGDTVGQALADTAFAPSVQITVLGSCTESVGIQRDDGRSHRRSGRRDAARPFTG